MCMDFVVKCSMYVIDFEPVLTANIAFRRLIYDYPAGARQKEWATSQKALVYNSACVIHTPVTSSWSAWLKIRLNP